MRVRRWRSRLKRFINNNNNITNRVCLCVRVFSYIIIVSNRENVNPAILEIEYNITRHVVMCILTHVYYTAVLCVCL